MAKFEYNMNQERRDSLIGVTYGKWDTTHACYDNLTADTLKILLDEKFADPDEYHNDAPKIQTIYDFLKEHPQFTASGYVIGKPREDYRVSIDGVSGEPESNKAFLEFVKLFRMADDFSADLGYCSCWFD